MARELMAAGAIGCLACIATFLLLCLPSTRADRTFDRIANVLCVLFWLCAVVLLAGIAAFALGA